MERIIRSLSPTALLTAAAVVFAFGTAFVLASSATLASSSPGASGNLAQAGHWLQFLGVLCLLGAVCTAGWEATVRSAWVDAAEIAVAAVGTLLLTLDLASYAASEGTSTAAPVTGAVGIGVWALLVLSRAARVSLAEQGTGHAAARAAAGALPGNGTARGRAELWLAAAIGLFGLALGYGFTSAAGAGAGIAAGLLQAVGVAVLAGAIAAARSRGMLGARPVSAVLAGLVLLALSFLAFAIVAGLNYNTLSGLGAGLTIATAIELAAVIVLGFAAWTQVRVLYPATRGFAPSSTAAQPAASDPAGQPAANDPAGSDPAGQ